MRPSGFRDEAARAAYLALYERAIDRAPLAVTGRDIATSYGTTHVLVAGDDTKPPLVALHAKGCSSTMWLPFLPVLAARHHVHLVDAVGDVGSSVASQVLSTPDRVVSWLERTLIGLGIGPGEPVALLGASIGSWMVAHYALARPGQVERIGLLCPAGLVSDLSGAFWRRAARAVLPRPTPARAAAFFDWMAAPAGRARLAEEPWATVREQFVVGMCRFRAASGEARPARCDVAPITDLEIPVMALIGRDECLHDGPLMAQRLSEAWPDADVEVVSGASHLLFVDRPDVVADRLRTFLVGAPERRRGVVSG